MTYIEGEDPMPTASLSQKSVPTITITPALAAALKKGREALNLSKDAFAKKLGWNSTMIRQIEERERKEIRTKSLQKLAQALQTTVQRLIEGAGGIVTTATAPAPATPSKAIRAPRSRKLSKTKPAVAKPKVATDASRGAIPTVAPSKAARLVWDIKFPGGQIRLEASADAEGARQALLALETLKTAIRPARP